MSLALPTEWHFETYLEVIEEANLVQGFFNSFDLCRDFHHDWSAGMCDGSICYGKKQNKD